MLAVALASPSLARAAEPAPADFDSEIAALMEQQEYREAAVRLEDELKRLPETQENRARRNELAGLAVNAYMEAFRAAPDECALANSGLMIANTYLDQLVAVYDEGARDSDEFRGMAKLQSELDGIRTERNCSVPEKALAPAPAPASPTPPIDSGSKRSDRPLVAGIAVSASLTGAMLAVSLGTGLSRYKEPFRGAAYQKIYDAAAASFEDAEVGNEVNFGEGNQMCSAGSRRDNVAVNDACGSWERLGTVAIASGVATGVLGVTTIALIAVLAKKRRNVSDTTALLRRHKATFGVSPLGRGGLNVNLGFAF